MTLAVPKPQPPATTHARPPIETCDLSVGAMIEGTRGWHEYCEKHGATFMLIYPDRKVRSVSLYEVLTSWREYRCYACNCLLWDREEHDRDEK